MSLGGAEHVTILMAVYNGAACLDEQLESFAAQDHSNWSLITSDDGSTDRSAAVIEAFRGRHPGHDVTCLDGPRAGFAANFLSLLARVPQPAGWLAFSDQDDVWLPDRLSRGLAALGAAGDRPALYCSQTWITDARLENRRLSPPRPRPPGFRNALAQNIAAGNTILLNPAAARLITAAAHEAGTVVAHDWWVYQMVTGAGGLVVHDPEPTLLYRQHDENQIGANDGTRARLVRIGMILKGDYRAWNDINIAALSASAARLSEEHRALLADFDRMRRGGFLSRILRMRGLGLYRQTRASTLALWLAAAAGRL